MANKKNKNKGGAIEFKIVFLFNDELNDNREKSNKQLQGIPHVVVCSR
jgi:hypothetical protein